MMGEAKNVEIVEVGSTKDFGGSTGMDRRLLAGLASINTHLARLEELLEDILDAVEARK